MAEEGFKRKLAAILSADAVDYSRLMGEDEEATVRTFKAYREVLTTLIQQHNGKVLDSPGDNLLAEFVSVVDAVQCAVAVQKEIKARNDELPEKRKMKFRIGINLGDVIQEEGRIYGDGVYHETPAITTHTYSTPGNYTLNARVTDNEGETATESLELTIADLTCEEKIAQAYEEGKQYVQDNPSEFGLVSEEVMNATTSELEEQISTMYTQDEYDAAVNQAEPDAGFYVIPVKVPCPE